MSDDLELDVSQMRSGAMPEDWHERNDTGYIPGGAAALAEKILSEPAHVREDHHDPSMATGKATGARTGLPQGYGDAAARAGGE
jgi:hypothetical protein